MPITVKRSTAYLSPNGQSNCFQIVRATRTEQLAEIRDGDERRL